MLKLGEHLVLLSGDLLWEHRDSRKGPHGRGGEGILGTHLEVVKPVDLSPRAG